MKFRPLLFLIVFLAALPAAAQDDAPASSESCRALVNDALAAAGQACSGVESNHACFGHGPVAATLNPASAAVFDSVGDTIRLDTLFGLHLGPLQPETGEWGLATLRVQGDVTLVLSGDVELRNTCSALLQQTVTLARETELRAGPGSDYASLGLLPAGTVLQVNACNCTGHWLRAVRDDGQTGWIAQGSVAGLTAAESLPVVQHDTPVYAPMQSFCLRSETAQPACAGAPVSGVLIQASPETDAAHLQINQVEIGVTSTAFIHSQIGGELTMAVLDGVGSVTLDGFTLAVPRGVQAVVPINADNQPGGPARLEFFDAEALAGLPVSLLPRLVEIGTVAPDTAPMIVGVEPCQVLSDQAETACRVHFVNADADEITGLEAAFVSAPEGDWESGSHPAPALLDGDLNAGIVSWDAACSVGSSIFIGPVVWRLTLTDAQGHQSPPFEASFNCQ